MVKKYNGDVLGNIFKWCFFIMIKSYLFEWLAEKDLEKSKLNNKWYKGEERNPTLLKTEFSAKKAKFISEDESKERTFRKKLWYFLYELHITNIGSDVKYRNYKV